ncbi:PPK2 family polyphosphate kinase [Flavitalea sp.]|nr:PPK2 family polyphosphate kinase [Flavitalea sp.]
MDKIKLSKISTRAPKEFEKEKTKAITAAMLRELNDLQNLLYAESKHSLLVILQGMDASGKDGVIRNVFGAFNPQGVLVHSFKVPTEEELSHDFLWRIHKSAPAKGMIQVFNRSHYEDILVTRVHNWCDDDLAKKRMNAINKFEELITEHNNTTILKFYLHVSAEEQAGRLEERMSIPSKQWKFNEGDFAEAKLRDKYIEMYEDAFEHCNEVPWTIVPADQNWYKEHLIASIILDTLKGFRMQYPPMQKSK